MIFCGVFYVQQLELNVWYNFIDSWYEVYVLFNDIDFNFFWGFFQILIVVLVSVGDVVFFIISVVVGVWQDNFQVYVFVVIFGFDYYGVGFGGVIIVVMVGVELLVFYFIIVGEICVDGICLYNNGSDFIFFDAGMNGGDFMNIIIGVGVLVVGEVYIGNYNNDGIICDIDGDGIDDDEDDDLFDFCVDFIFGMEDFNNLIWGNVDCDGDGVVNVDEDSDVIDFYDFCSLVLVSVS